MNIIIFSLIVIVIAISILFMLYMIRNKLPSSTSSQLSTLSKNNMIKEHFGVYSDFTEDTFDTKLNFKQSLDKLVSTNTDDAINTKFLHIFTPIQITSPISATTPLGTQVDKYNNKFKTVAENSKILGFNITSDKYKEITNVSNINAYIQDKATNTHLLFGTSSHNNIKLNSYYTQNHIFVKNFRYIITNYDSIRTNAINKFNENEPTYTKSENSNDIFWGNISNIKSGMTKIYEAFIDKTSTGDDNQAIILLNDIKIANQDKVTKHFGTEYAYMCSEIMFGILANKMLAPEAAITADDPLDDLMKLFDNDRDNGDAENSAQLDPSTFYDQYSDVDFTYHFYIVVTLLRLLLKIITSNTLGKYNNKYFTYLFYSFHSGSKIFKKYIDELADKHKSSDSSKQTEQFALDYFFKCYQFEGLYKLFILALSKKAVFNIFYELETDSSKIKNGLSLTAFPKDFNIKNYFFWDEKETDKMLIPAITSNSLNSPKRCNDSLFNKDYGSNCIKINSYSYDNTIKSSLKLLVDKSRVMYLVQTENPSDFDITSDNFFKKTNSRFSACVDYDDDDSIREVKFKCTQISDTFVFNDWVSSELLDSAKHICTAAKTEKSCDSEPKCFWQDDKCYDKNAPASWRGKSPTRYVNEFGLEEMTKCDTFKGEFYCPKDRCYWDGMDSKCKPFQQKYGARAGNVNGGGDTSIKIEASKVDCDAINHFKDENKESMAVECKQFNCFVETDKNKKSWCQRRERDDREKKANNKSCSLQSDKESCLRNNFDPNVLSNRCKWVEEGSQKFCFDEHIPTPCKYFTNEHECPSEAIKDNMGNFIGEGYCDWVPSGGTEVCKDKDIFNTGGSGKLNEKSSIDVKEWKCHYNYMNSSGNKNDCEKDDDCKLVTLNNITDKKKPLTKCINTLHRPCSIINNDDCKKGDGVEIEGIIDDKKICTFEDGQCKYNSKYDTVSDNLDSLFNAEYDNKVDIIEDTLETLKQVTDANRQTYLQTGLTVYGDATLPTLTGGSTEYNSLTTNSKFINNISIGDEITLQGTTNLGSSKITNIDLINNTIEFNPITSDITSQTNIIWFVNNPNVGLFNSIQYSDVMLDTMRINEFYETY